MEKSEVKSEVKRNYVMALKMALKVAPKMALKVAPKIPKKKNSDIWPNSVSSKKQNQGVYSSRANSPRCMREEFQCFYSKATFSIYYVYMCTCIHVFMNTRFSLFQQDNGCETVCLIRRILSIPPKLQALIWLLSTPRLMRALAINLARRLPKSQLPD